MTSPAVTDLSCPDGENFAAIALQLQETALEAEDRIFELERNLRAAVNRPTIVQTSTANITGLVSGSIGDQYVGPQGGGTFVTTFNNTGVNDNIDVSSGNLLDKLGEGLYEVGIYVGTAPSGTVDNDTYRIARIDIARKDPAGFDGRSRAVQAVETVFETNTGTLMDMTLTLTARLLPGDWIKFTYEHGNTSSTLTAFAPIVIWLSKLSTTDAVVVT